jgi:FAD/FMN-containing dehydrogenase
MREQQTILKPETVDKLARQVRGPLLRPDDNGYDEARKLYNGMIDRFPALIVRCQDGTDVMASVNFARDHDLPLAIRGGGHNGAGLGMCNDGVVIDLSRMNSVRVDPTTQTVRAEGGCTWGDVDHATHAFGLATPSGFISTTGIGGLTLGGGFGYLTRKYGLTIDNLLSADLVLADGRFVTTSPQEHPDLFWAIRGGGGNFGVATSFEFQLHPVSTVYGGPMLWSLEQTPEVIRWYREFMPQAPGELNGFFALMTVPPVPPFPEALHLQKVGGIVWCYAGPQEQVDEVFAPIREVGPPLLDGTHSMPYPMLQSAFDALYPPGLQWYWRADFFTELSDDCIAEHLKYARQLPTPHSTAHLYPIDGAVHQVGANDTAFSYREAKWAQVIAGVDPDPANAERISTWSKDYWDAVHPYSAGGAYVNMMMEEGDERIKAAYRDNYARLVALKNRYDPTNLFHINQNIKPTGGNSSNGS